MLLKFKIISGTIWNSISAGFSFILNMGTVVVLAHLLAPEIFGLFAMTTVVINVLDSFADMGTSAAIISYKDVTDEELTALFYFNILLGTLLTVLMIAGVPLFVYYYKEPRLSLYLMVLAVNFLITSPGTIFNVLMRKEMQFKTLSMITSASAVAYSAGAIIYAFFWGGIMSLVVGVVLQAITSTALTVYFGLKIWKPIHLTFKFAHMKRFITFGLFQMGEQVVNRFNRNIDYLLIGRFLGAEALGFYYMAYNLMVKPTSKINPIITSVAFPAFSKISGDEALLKKYFLKMIRYICYVMAPIYMLFFILSEQIILFFYGGQWVKSVPVFAVFSFLGFLYSLGNPSGSLILAKGRADITFWMNVSQTVFLFTANYIGVHYGIIGVAVSSLAVTFVIFWPMGFFVRYYLAKIEVGEFLRQLKNTVLIALIAGGIVMLIDYYLISSTLLGELIIFSGIFLIIYTGLLLMADKTEMQILRNTVKEFLNGRKGARPEEGIKK